MSADRSDEIRVIVLKQRIDKFLAYLQEEKRLSSAAVTDAGTPRALSQFHTVTTVLDKAAEIFSGDCDEPVVLD